MQPGMSSDDLHSILNRFSTWAGEQPGNGHGNGHGTAEVRELGYEEAIAPVRSRRPRAERAAGPRPAETRTKAAEESGKTAPEAAVDQTAILKEKPGLPAAAMGRQEAAPTEVKTEPVRPVFLNARPEAGFAIRPRAGLSARRAKAARLAAAARHSVATRAALEAAETMMVRRPGAQAGGAAGPAAAGAAEPTGRKPSAKPGTQPETAALTPPPAQRARTAPAKPAQQTAAATATKAAKASGKKAAAKAKPHRAKKPEFRQVLAETVQPAKAAAATPKRAKAPDRNVRITTRFSASEQRRLERCAAHAGLTLSAYLRACALTAETAEAGGKAAEPQRAADSAAVPPAAETLYAPRNAGIGGWLTLLRQRFLSSPARFAERA